MKYTGNYNLKKPDGTDVVNIEDLNENADIIDAELKKLNDAIKDLDADGITLPDGKTISEKFEEITEEVGNIQELNTNEKANIVAAINEINQALIAHKADYEQHTPYAIATGTNTYTATIQGITTLVEGMSIKVKFQNANTGTATLNINGLGAKAIKKSNGNDLVSGNIKAGQILHLVYTGSVFQLLGEGGEYGTAQPNHVLEGITFGTEDGLKVGTMPNRGRVNQTLTTQGGTYTIPEGYHDGTGTVKAQFANLIAENVKNGVNIGGVVGRAAVAGEPTRSTEYVRRNSSTTINMSSDKNILIVYHSIATRRSLAIAVRGLGFYEMERYDDSNYMTGTDTSITVTNNSTAEMAYVYQL